ncbi:HNH endonuclease [Nodosilinea sp. LEGE 06152]|uniref:HNH endonuclease n=1 Tax=Nodosilinea sp. LEGE 06152 TaxID=2777966 RepID=UPI001D1470BE|nr:HNH endonuclease [Nodosilinea sp. LEGE 06152]
MAENYTAFPGEIESKDYHEGAVHKVFVNAYERDPKARERCIDCHGLSCKICNFNFGEEFGDLDRGFINVHHLKPLSEVSKEYQVDPIRDLLPVCPNCHAMFHRKEPALSIEEVKAARMGIDSLT